MEVGVLGPLELRVGGRPVPVRRGLPRTLLVALVLRAPEPVSVDLLVEQLWGDDAPQHPANALQTQVSYLRRLLRDAGGSEVLVTRPGGYALLVPADAVDARRFERLLAQARERAEASAVDELEAALDLLDQALALWRGEALGEFAGELFGLGEATRLNERRLEAIELRCDVLLALGRHQEVASELSQHVHDHPLREQLRCRLMLALYRCGRQAEALQVYEQARAVLAEELGLDPGPELRQMEQAVLEQAVHLSWTPPRPALRPRAAAAPRLSHPSVWRSTQAGPASPAGLADPAGPAADETPPRNPSAERARAGGPGATLGRDRERRVLTGVLERAKTGRGSVVLVEGEPGIGKSRLLEEFADQARAAGALVTFGRCFEGGGAPPFWPWIQVLRQLVRTCGENALADAAAGWEPELRHVLPEMSSADSATALGADPFRVYELVVTVVVRLATQPVVVVLDDLHGADADSVRTLLVLADQVASAPVVVVAAYRHEEVDDQDELADAVARLARQRAERLRLGRLCRDDAVAVIENVTGVEPSQSVADAVFARTDGNPFFTVELARFLEAEGALQDDVASLAQAAIPAAVHDVLQRRLRRLPAAAQAVLTVAAVQGREFDLDVVTEVAGVTEEEALEALEVAQRLHLVGDGMAVGRFRFSHALVPDAIVRSLNSVRRARLHRDVADALARRHGDDPLRCSEIAHHAIAALPTADPVWALPLLRRAADQAASALAFEHAAQLHSHRLDLVRSLPSVPDRKRHEFEALVDLSLVWTWTKGYQAPEVADVLSHALRLIDSVDEVAAVLAALVARWANYTLRGNYAAAEETIAAIGRVAERRPEPIALFAFQATDGIIAMHRGRIDESLALLRKCEGMLPDLTDEAFARVTLSLPAVACGSFLAVVQALNGDPAGAVDRVNQVVSLAERAEHEFSVSFALSFRALVAAVVGDAVLAERSARQGTERARRNNFWHNQTMAEAVAGWATGMLGDRAGAHRLEDAVDELLCRGAPALRGFYFGLLADVWLRHDEVSCAVSALDAGFAALVEYGEGFWLPELHRLRAVALTRLGDHAGAARELDAARAAAEEQGADLLSRRADTTSAPPTATSA